MKHYHRCKGYRRHPGRGGRPVYFVPMSRAEVNERRLMYGLIGSLTAVIGGVALWMTAMI